MGKSYQRIDEVRASGDWLGDELRALGCDEKLMRDICFATGQRQSMLIEGDMWEPARDALERYKRGEWDTPGHAFAEELCRQAWGDPPDMERVKAWLQNIKDLRKARVDGRGEGTEGNN